MSELHTNTDTDADKYILNGVEVTPNEVIETITIFLQKQQFRVGRLNARIAELENEHNVWLIGASNAVKNLEARIAELEAESERFTVHSDIERQDDKSPNDTQTQTIVYGKWIPVSERLPEVYRDGDGEFIPFLVCENDKGFPYRALYDGLNWGDGMFVADVTHWMPLPSLPEVQE